MCACVFLQRSIRMCVTFRELDLGLDVPTRFLQRICRLGNSQFPPSYDSVPKIVRCSAGTSSLCNSKRWRKVVVVEVCLELPARFTTVSSQTTTQTHSRQIADLVLVIRHFRLQSALSMMSPSCHQTSSASKRRRRRFCSLSISPFSRAQPA